LFPAAAEANDANDSKSPCKVTFEATLAEHSVASFDASAKLSFVLATAAALGVAERAVRVGSVRAGSVVVAAAVVVASEAAAVAAAAAAADPAGLAAAVARAGLGACAVSTPVVERPPPPPADAATAATTAYPKGGQDVLNGLTVAELARARALFAAAAAQGPNAHAGGASSIRLAPFKKLMLQLCKDANAALAKQGQPPLPVPKDKDLGAAFAQADANKSGEVDLKEFLALYALAHAGQVCRR
jgi:hypothetical protein